MYIIQYYRCRYAFSVNPVNKLLILLGTQWRVSVTYIDSGSFIVVLDSYSLRGDVCGLLIRQNRLPGSIFDIRILAERAR